MSRRLWACLAVMIAATWSGAARADLCEKCSRMMFIESTGTCTLAAARRPAGR